MRWYVLPLPLHLATLLANYLGSLEGIMQQDRAH
jgi:hypothetical protein